MAEQRDEQESFLTVAEVAAILKLNQQTVRNWIDQGSLPALRIGRRVRIKRSDFERILAESYSGGTTSGSSRAAPSAEDFWGGEPVGLAEPNPTGAEEELPDLDALAREVADEDDREGAGEDDLDLDTLSHP